MSLTLDEERQTRFTLVRRHACRSRVGDASTNGAGLTPSQQHMQEISRLSLKYNFLRRRIDVLHSRVRHTAHGAGRVPTLEAHRSMPHQSTNHRGER